MQAAEQAVEQPIDVQTSASDAERDQSLANEVLGDVDHPQANLARYRDNAPLAIELSKWALTRLSEDILWVGFGPARRRTTNLASVYASLGEVAAEQTYRQSITLEHMAGFVYATIHDNARLMEMLTIQGQLNQAIDVFDQIQPLLEEQAGPAVGMVYMAFLIRPRAFHRTAIHPSFLGLSQQSPTPHLGLQLQESRVRYHPLAEMDHESTTFRLHIALQTN
ncbi:MAG: hypothetical protein AAF702_45770 [Chloroflexota bacterium]